ncbi:MAG: hypothetical protein ACPL4E_04280 [Thermoproteota archaeon]
MRTRCRKLVSVLFLILFLGKPVLPASEGGSKWLSEGDFAEYDAGFEYGNVTHLIFFLGSKSPGILRWQVIRESCGIVELTVSLNVSGEAYWCIREYNKCQTSWVSIYRNVTLTVNVSSREAKYMGHDIGYIPFWVDRMPAKGQRIPMVKLENGSILHGEVITIWDSDVDWYVKKSRPLQIRVLNPDPDNFISILSSYDWYSGLALYFEESGYSPELAPGCCYYTLPDGTNIEILGYGGTPFGRLLGLGFACSFTLRSTSIKIGPPSEEKEIDFEITLIVGFFTASWILIVYVFLRQRAGHMRSELSHNGYSC